MTPLPPTKRSKNACQVALLKTSRWTGGCLGSCDHVSQCQPLKSSVKPPPRSLKQNNPWVVIYGSRFVVETHRWDGSWYLGWDWLVGGDFFQSAKKKSKKKSKNNLTDCGSWLPIYFFFAILFFLLKMLLGHTWANSKKPCPSTWMANPPDILNGWTCGVYHIIYGRSGHHISTVHPWLHHPTRVITRSAWKEQNHMGAWTGP